MALTEKLKKFCNEYLIDLNATQAAIRAGYSEKSAKEIGYENLTKPHVQEYVAELRRELAEKTDITPEKVLREYGRIAFHDIRSLYDSNGNLLNVNELNRDTAAAIAGVDVTTERTKDGEEQSYTKKVKLIDKRGALDSLARHLGMFEKDNAQSAVTVKINLDQDGN